MPSSDVSEDAIYIYICWSIAYEMIGYLGVALERKSVVGFVGTG